VRGLVYARATLFFEKRAARTKKRRSVAEPKKSTAKKGQGSFYFKRAQHAHTQKHAKCAALVTRKKPAAH
jgi:hypothetical protein